MDINYTFVQCRSCFFCVRCILNGKQINVDSNKFFLKLLSLFYTVFKQSLTDYNNNYIESEYPLIKWDEFKRKQICSNT